MSLTTLLVPTYVQMLRTLSGLLDKAKDQLSAAQAEALLSARLSPDMHSLASQLRFVCFQAQEATFRLRGLPLPEALERLAAEGRDAGATPGSIAEAQARIAEAVGTLGDLAPDALDAGAELTISLELPGGIAFDMTGAQYARDWALAQRDWALAQFYFHVVTAYAILRHHGVRIGKADYVPHMFAYLRPGSLPTG